MFSSENHRLEVGIIDAMRVKDLFLNNNVEEAKNIIYSETNTTAGTYHCCVKALYSFLEAIIAFSPEIIKSSAEYIDDSLYICQKFRKKDNLIQSFNRLVNKVDYNSYTCSQAHAELCYAEILLVRGLLSFIEDESMLGFISSATKIRSCIGIYNDCYEMLENRDWSNDIYKMDFESGVLIGVGSFNLLISLLPKKLIKILEFIGFSGNLEKGLDYLLKSLTMDCARKFIGELMLLLYNTHILTSISDEDGNLDLVQSIIDDNLKKYPESFVFLYFRARLESCRGNFSKSSDIYNQAWKVQTDWPELHNIIFWEMFWIKCFLMDWKEAEMFINYLLEKSRWSPCMYAFGKASVLCMKENLTPDESSTLNKLMKDVPKLKLNIGGKTIAAEKFVIKQTEKYFDQDQILLTLPIFQLMFLWNKFTCLKHNLDTCQKIYDVIEKTSTALETTPKLKYYNDDKCLLLLLKGACLRHMKNYTKAIECLENVASLETKLVSETHLIPFSKVELAFVYKDINDNKKAICLLESAEKYKNYSFSSRLNFKIHTALSKLKNKKNIDQSKNTTQKISLDQNSSTLTHKPSTPTTKSKSKKKRFFKKNSTLNTSDTTTKSKSSLHQSTSKSIKLGSNSSTKKKKRFTFRRNKK